MSNIIIDCGGGILVEAAPNPQAEELFSDRKTGLLHGSAQIVLLKRDIDRLIEKSLESHSRPELDNPKGGYPEIMRRRMAWYEREADYILDMELLSIEEATELIRKRYFSHEA